MACFYTEDDKKRSYQSSPENSLSTIGYIKELNKYPGRNPLLRQQILLLVEALQFQEILCRRDFCFRAQVLVKYRTLNKNRNFRV